jgi:acyl-CoA reductase-like NAD-dependent aldehyde dehydrogenase
MKCAAIRRFEPVAACRTMLRFEPALHRAGRVVISGMTDDPQAPSGGFKYSGVGREYGRYGIEAFLETRAILES